MHQSGRSTRLETLVGCGSNPSGDLDTQARGCAEAIARKVEEILGQRLPLTDAKDADSRPQLPQ